MKFFRQSRVVTALIALVSVLFMQLAVSAYACPSLNEGKTMTYDLATAPGIDHASMIGCEGQVDDELPSLCYVHSQYGDQSSGNAEQPNPSPALTITAIPVIRAVAPSVRPYSDFIASSPRMRGSMPPLTIQNCCFRI